MPRPSLFRFWLALVPAMVLPFLGTIIYFVLWSDQPVAKSIYGLTKLFTLVWPVLVYIWLWQRPLPKINLRSARHWKSLPLGCLTAAAILAVMLALTLAVPEVLRDAAPQIRGKVVELGILPYYWAFAFFLAVFHSLIEEYYWRWFVFGHLREKLSKPAAYLLAAAAFASHHIIVTCQFFPLTWGLLLGLSVGIGGLIWSWQYERQQTLAGAWLSHMIVDFGILTLGYVTIH